MTDENRRAPLLFCDLLDYDPKRTHAAIQSAAGAGLVTPLVQVHGKAGFGKPAYDAYLRQQVEYVGPLDRGRHNQDRTGASSVAAITPQPQTRLVQHDVPGRFSRGEALIVQQRAHRSPERIAHEEHRKYGILGHGHLSPPFNRMQPGFAAETSGC